VIYDHRFAFGILKNKNSPRGGRRSDPERHSRTELNVAVRHRGGTRSERCIPEAEAREPAGSLVGRSHKLKNRMKSRKAFSRVGLAETTSLTEKRTPLPVPDVSRMGYNPANFAFWIGEEPWVPGYLVYYAISFYDSVTKVESARSGWWGPKTDPKKLYGGFGLTRIPTDPTGRATSRRIWRKFEGQAERMIHEIPDNNTAKYHDDVR